MTVYTLARLGFVCLLLFYDLATSKVISGRATLGDQATQSHYPTQSHCRDTVLTSVVLSYQVNVLVAWPSYEPSYFTPASGSTSGVFGDFIWHAKGFPKELPKGHIRVSIGH